MKVVSLLPAATEIMCAIGAESLLAGVSHECDYPGGIGNTLPCLTRSRAAAEGSGSHAIHQSMINLIKNALSIYQVDADSLKRIDPDLILTQDLCRVCAVSYDDVCAAVGDLTCGRSRVISLHPTRLEDVYDDIQRIGAAAGCLDRAQTLVSGLRDRVLRLRNRTSHLPTRSVLMVEWMQPLIAAGLWSGDLAAPAGALALAGEPGEHGRSLTAEELVQLDPDVVVIKPCGFRLDRTLEEVPRFPEYFPWFKWRAAREGRVFIVDGNAYFNRSGPRLVDSAEILAGCVHEEACMDLRRRYSGAVKRVLPDLTVEDLHG